MRLLINGLIKEIAAETLNDIIEHYGLENKMIIVEVDGIIIDKVHWDATKVANHMKIELVHFVGGG